MKILFTVVGCFCLLLGGIFLLQKVGYAQETEIGYLEALTDQPLSYQSFIQLSQAGTKIIEIGSSTKEITGVDYIVEKNKQNQKEETRYIEGKLNYIIKELNALRNLCR